MFTFFLFPRHFIESPITREEKRHSSRSQRASLILFALLAVASGIYTAQTFWQFAGTGAASFLFSVIVVCYAFHLVVVVFAVNRTARSIGRLLEPQSWENLIITGISASRIVIGKWWSLTVAVIPIFLLTAPLKLCAAYGLARHLHMTEHVFTAFYGPLLYSGDYSSLDLHPSLAKCFCGLFILICYSVVEAGLITALTMACTLIFRRLGIVLVLLLRGTISLVTFLAWLRASAFFLELEILGNELMANSDFVYYHKFQSIRAWQQILGFLQFTFTPLADDGMVLVTDLIRPISTHYHSLQTLINICLSFLPLILIIAVSLNIAQRLAIHKGAAPMVVNLS